MTYTVLRFDGVAWVEVGVYGDFETAEERAGIMQDSGETVRVMSQGDGGRG